VCSEVEPRVRRVLEISGDLLNITGEVLLEEQDFWQLLRYFCGPPVSEEDL
jgi:hypothetical protein